MKLVVATHTGSGTEIVRTLVEHLDGYLVPVHTTLQARELDFDRLILLGGADISPRWYGETIDGAWGVDYVRDEIEWALIRRALNNRIPTLGICRGHQMLATASGGSLYQNIGHSHLIAGGHALKDVKTSVARYLPSHKVNSLHHQAIRHVPTGFQVAARSEDGCIESIFRPGYLGVQFHPEFLIEREIRWIKLFQWFMDGLDMRQPPQPHRVQIVTTKPKAIEAPAEDRRYPLSRIHRGWRDTSWKPNRGAWDDDETGLSSRYSATTHRTGAIHQDVTLTDTEAEIEAMCDRAIKAYEACPE